jgi:hypothetical protein
LVVDARDGTPEPEGDVAPGPKLLIYAEIFLPHGDRFEIARLIGRKRKDDGLFVGRKHQNLILDLSVFIIKFPDGDQKYIAYNVLTEHLGQ